jgi:hypothetical protein
MDKKILSEDGVTLQPGDRAYNYYDMKPGRIPEAEPGWRWHDQSPSAQFINYNQDVWVDFQEDDGGVSLLNGQRLCSMAFAVRRGFKNAVL